ncbi:MAG: DUF4401 domain-containing protein [Chromatiales bacterium]
MTLTARKALWQRLQAAGLVTGDIPPAHAHASPWYVRAMLGVSGWIGALFLLGFVGFGLDIFDNEMVAAVVGAGCCAAAAVIFRSGRHHDFASQFGLAVSLAGQVLFVHGVSEWLHGPEPRVFLIIAAFEVALVIFLPNALHRMWSTWAAVIALYFALVDIGVYGILGGVVAVAMALLWLNEFRWGAYGRWLRPVAYGLTLSLIQLDGTPFLHRWWMFWYAQSTPPVFLSVTRWVSIGLLGTVLLYTVWMLLQREGTDLRSRSGRTALLGALLAVLLSFYAPGLAIALLIIVLGFANGNRVVLGLGLLSLGSYLSWYYYSLQITLLNKSLVLVVTGAVLILLRYLLQHRLAGTRAEEPAHA